MKAHFFFRYDSASRSSSMPGSMIYKTQRQANGKNDPYHLDLNINIQ